MKKINIGLAIFLLSFASGSFAASTNTTKNDVAAPYYNGGFSFGLASYSTMNTSENSSADDVNLNSISEAQAEKAI